MNQFVQPFFSPPPLVSAISASEIKVLIWTTVVHVIRISAIYDKSRTVLYGMGSLLAAQIVVTAVCCGFYMCMGNSPILTHPWGSLNVVAVPLKPGQGCIAGPKHNWVGIYWLLPTLLYTVSVSLERLTPRKLLTCISVRPGDQTLHRLPQRSSGKTSFTVETDVARWAQPLRGEYHILSPFPLLLKPPSVRVGC